MLPGEGGSDRVTLAHLHQMKAERRKIVAVVVYDYQMATIADRARVDIVSVGDSVGVNLWGHATQLEVTLDQMILVCQAARRGVSRALVSCDLPLGTLREGIDATVRAARRVSAEGGADVVKLDGAADCPQAVEAIARAGIPVWAQFGATPHSVGGRPPEPFLADAAESSVDGLTVSATRLEQAGAALLDFTHSGPVAGPAVAAAARIPVLGGLGGGPWLDGRIRSLFAAVGYSASALDDDAPRYANVAEVTLAAIAAFSDDVRAGRQIRGS